MAYFVYLLRCADGTLYCGTTNDLEKRVHAHNFLKTGARYTKARRPVELVYSVKCRGRSAALKKEFALKQMTRKEKIKLFIYKNALLRYA